MEAGPGRHAATGAPCGSPDPALRAEVPVWSRTPDRDLQAPWIGTGAGWP